jgi:pyruvate carboxylase
VPARAELTLDEEKSLAGPQVRETLDRLLFPGPARDHQESRAAYGDLSVLPTGAFLYGLRPGHEISFDLEPGVKVLAGLEAVGEIDEAGFRQVICTVNGQLRTLSVRDRSVAADVPPVERADPSDPGQVPAPFDGSVTLRVTKGTQVAAGEVVATIEAMKMEASITAPTTGTVTRLAIPEVTQVQAGDLLLVIS